MTAKEAYESIVSAKLFEFHAKNPTQIVLVQIRRHSEGIDLPNSASTKHFQLIGENKFWPLDQPKHVVRPSGD